MSTSKRVNTAGSQDGPSSKKVKNEDSFSFPPSTFEEELAMFESIDYEEGGTSQLPSSQGGSQQRHKWRRPPLPNLDPSSDAIIFQQIDIDHYVGDPIPGMPGAQSGPVPIVRMFGVTMSGNSVCAHVRGFHPYFYVPVGENGFLEEQCSAFRNNLNKAVMEDMRSNKEGVQRAVLAVEICKKCSMYGFYFNRKFDFLKITVALPRLVASTRRVLSSISVPPFGSCSNSFESNIELEVRFMVDAGVVGCSWIECPAGEYVSECSC